MKSYCRRPLQREGGRILLASVGSFFTFLVLCDEQQQINYIFFKTSSKRWLSLQENVCKPSKDHAIDLGKLSNKRCKSTMKTKQQNNTRYEAKRERLIIKNTRFMRHLIIFCIHDDCSKLIG